MESREFKWIGPDGKHQLVLVWVPGTSNMPYAFGSGRHRRSMSLDGFFSSTTPVTQALWLRVMGNNPAVGRDVRCPVENVSWQQITAPSGFLDRLNASDVRSTLAAGDVRLFFGFRRRRNGNTRRGAALGGRTTSRSVGAITRMTSRGSDRGGDERIRPW